MSLLALTYHHLACKWLRLPQHTTGMYWGKVKHSTSTSALWDPHDCMAVFRLRTPSSLEATVTLEPNLWKMSLDIVLIVYRATTRTRFCSTKTFICPTYTTSNGVICVRYEEDNWKCLWETWRCCLVVRPDNQTQNPHVKAWITTKNLIDECSMAQLSTFMTDTSHILKHLYLYHVSPESFKLRLSPERCCHFLSLTFSYRKVLRAWLNHPRCLPVTKVSPVAFLFNNSFVLWNVLELLSWTFMVSRLVGASLPSVKSLTQCLMTYNPTRWEEKLSSSQAMWLVQWLESCRIVACRPRFNLLDRGSL